MQNWQTIIAGRSAPRAAQARVTEATSIEELRARHHSLANFGALPEDLIIERAQMGQVKGEWLRVSEAQPQRLLFYLHGGGYVSGSPESHRGLIAKLCRASGAAALSIDYRLGPEHPFPAGLRDAVDSYRFLIAKGFPADAVVLAGDGAGGGLAFATMLAIRNGGMPMPAGIVALSPWADLTLSGWSVMQNADHDNALSWDMLFLSARRYLKGANAADPYASPIYGTMREFPPIIVHAGSREILRDDASRLGDLAAASNVPVSVEVYDGMGHLFQAVGQSSEAKVSLNRLGQFIRARTPEPASSAEPEPIGEAGQGLGPDMSSGAAEVA